MKKTATTTAATKTRSMINTITTEEERLSKKISLATEGFTPNMRIHETTLKDRNRLSSENALTICDYVLAMKREVNPRLSYIGLTIQSSINRFFTSPSWSLDNIMKMSRYTLYH